MSDICYIFGSGDYSGTKIDLKAIADGYIIAADGGYLQLEKYGIVPDLLIGDFDSVDRMPEHFNVVQYPVMKDDTDTMLAVKTAFDMGHSCFVIYGGTGGRLDHTIANIQTLSYISAKGGIGFLRGSGFTAAVVTESSLRFEGMKDIGLSVFSLSEMSKGVSLSGVKYCMTNGMLSRDMPLGVSNRITEDTAKVIVSEGSLLIMWSDDGMSQLPKVIRNNQIKGE